MRELLPSLRFTEKPWPDYWYFGQTRRLVKDADVDDEVDKVRSVGRSPGRGQSDVVQSTRCSARCGLWMPQRANQRRATLHASKQSKRMHEH